MPTGGRLQLIKRVIYRLKRSYGCPLAVYRQSPEAIDLATGRATITRISIEIKRAVVLPSNIHRGFTYDIGFLKANSNFTYGGIYTDAIRGIIIDRSDLPKDFVLDATDEFYVIYENKRWELKSVEEFEHGLAYYITLSRVDGAITNEIHNLSVRDHLIFNEELGGGDAELQFLNISDRLTFTQVASIDRRIYHLVVQDTLIFREVINESRT